MPKTIYSKRDDLICGKIEKLQNVILSTPLEDDLKVLIIESLLEIKDNAQSMENKLISRKLEVLQFRKKKQMKEKDLRQEVIELLTKDIKTAYALNKKTGINLGTCQQIIIGNWNPRFSTLLEFKQKYDSNSKATETKDSQY